MQVRTPRHIKYKRIECFIHSMRSTTNYACFVNCCNGIVQPAKGPSMALRRTQFHGKTDTKTTSIVSELWMNFPISVTAGTACDEKHKRKIELCKNTGEREASRSTRPLSATKVAGLLTPDYRSYNSLGEHTTTLTTFLPIPGEKIPTSCHAIQVTTYRYMNAHEIIPTITAPQIAQTLYVMWIYERRTRC